VRIGIIGKFPPIEGGVSARTYWTAHGLAMRGNEVHIVTNAKEVLPPFRMHMREEDWQRCEATYPNGSVTVHWTDPVDRSQYYIPMASPFVSKLAATAARVHSQHPFDVILSHYLEPYGVAGHLAAEMTGAPHVVRMAGSDAGRLWHHPQFEALYDHVLRSAALVIAAGAVAERSVGRGVERDRIALAGSFAVPEDVFTPMGPGLNLASLRIEVERHAELRDLLWGGLAPGMPHFGVYGKLGESKGSFALLAAMHRLARDGLEVGLLAPAHGRAPVEQRFRATVRELGLADRILQIPYLPNWRVPEFLRGCLAVCCLEQNFPIAFHAPIVPREVLLCGGCLVGSTELIRKLPGWTRLPHGYGCVAIKDVDDIPGLSRTLAAIVEDPQRAACVGARGCVFARDLQEDVGFPETLERVLEAAADGRRGLQAPRRRPKGLPREGKEERFPLTRLGQAALSKELELWRPPLDIVQAREVLAALERGVACGRTGLQRFAMAARVEIDIAAAEDEELDPNLDDDSLFRVRLRRWAVGENEFVLLVPILAPGLRIVEFEYDVSRLLGVETAAQLPVAHAPGPSYILAFACSAMRRRDPLLVDSVTARILRLCDGTRTVSEIVGELAAEGDVTVANNYLAWIESLFVGDLLWLWDQRIGPTLHAHGACEAGSKEGNGRHAALPVTVPES
jgi:glycosyltransferase involved in cell wall biosynthesis